MRNPLSNGARSGLIVSCVAIAFAMTSTAAVKRPIKKPTFDPSAEQVELFDAMEAGQVDAKLILKDEFEGNVFIENKTDKPLTIKLPKAAVGVHVLKQGFGPGGGQQGGQQGQGGQSQSGGGGFGGQQGGQQGGQGMGGGNFFSVPSERVVQVPFHSVCLNHGKPSPRPAMTYKLVRLESYTKDPVLQELLIMVGTGKLDRQVAQAAVWHVTDDMSWETLAAKFIRRTGGVGNQPYFTREQLIQALSLFSQADVKAREKNDGELKTEKKL